MDPSHKITFQESKLFTRIFTQTTSPLSISSKKEHAYNQIVLPSVEYCCSIWDPYQQTSIHKLEMLQHRAARFVLNRPWRRNCRDSVTDMLTTLNWQTLEKRREQSRLTLLFKFTNSLIYVPNQYLPVLSPVTSTRANIL